MSANCRFRPPGIRVNVGYLGFTPESRLTGIGHNRLQRSFCRPHTAHAGICGVSCSVISSRASASISERAALKSSSFAAARRAGIGELTRRTTTYGNSLMACVCVPRHSGAARQEAEIAGEARNSVPDGDCADRRSGAAPCALAGIAASSGLFERNSLAYRGSGAAGRHCDPLPRSAVSQDAAANAADLPSTRLRAAPM